MLYFDIFFLGLCTDLIDNFQLFKIQVLNTINLCLQVVNSVKHKSLAQINKSKTGKYKLQNLKCHIKKFILIIKH